MGTKLVVSLLAASMAATPAIAHAVHPRGEYVYVERDFSPAPPPVQSIGPGLILYFNRNAATYTPGEDDSRQNVSGVPIATTSLAAWSCGDAKWQQFMTCIRDQYAPFNVMVTDVDPGSTPHVETHVGGLPGSMRTQDFPSGLPCNNTQGCVGGIAPLGCFGGVDNAVTYVFADAPFYGCNAQVLCETAAQESAHAFGLDHEGYCPDPMTYEQDCGAKKFRDVTAPCGEFEDQATRNCACPGTGTTQNSYQTLLQIFGPAVSQPPNDPPACQITSPSSGASVTAGFGITVDAEDDVGVSRVELWIDGAMVTFKSNAPFTFSAPSTLAPGSHTIEARAIDAGGLQGTSSVTVTLGQPQQCGSPDDCPSGQTCVNSACVLIPTDPGDLGSPCNDGSDCVSNECGAGPGGTLCTEPCDPSAQPGDCPGGFECLPTGAGGACWPSSGTNPEDGTNNFTGGCGCLVGGRGSSAPGALVAGLLLGLVLVSRRRR